MTERARIDGLPISHERFAELLDAMMPAIERSDARLRPANLLRNAARAGVRAISHENASTSRSSRSAWADGSTAPTSSRRPSPRSRRWDYDHTDVLGDTIEAIACEKAGIAKRGVPLVVALRCRPGALARDRASAREAGAPSGTRRRRRSHRSRSSAEPPAAQALSKPARRAGAIALRLTGARASFSAPTPRRRSRCSSSSATSCGRVAKRSRAASRSSRFPGAWRSSPRGPSVVFDIAHNAEKAAVARRVVTRAFRRTPHPLRRRDRREQGRAPNPRDSRGGAVARSRYVVYDRGRRAIPPGAARRASPNRSAAGGARSAIRSKR